MHLSQPEAAKQLVSQEANAGMCERRRRRGRLVSAGRTRVIDPHSLREPQSETARTSDSERCLVLTCSCTPGSLRLRPQEGLQGARGWPMAVPEEGPGRAARGDRGCVAGVVHVARTGGGGGVRAA
eukprot:656958-Hanusia_phi.AAC.1